MTTEVERELAPHALFKPMCVHGSMCARVHNKENNANKRTVIIFLINSISLWVAYVLSGASRFDKCQVQ